MPALEDETIDAIARCFAAPPAGTRAIVTGTEIVTKGGPLDAHPATPPAPAIVAALRAGVVAKTLFTTGSTGEPKGVVTAHGMLAVHRQMMLQALPLLGNEPPVRVDWLPWSHTFGGNSNLGLVFANGGTLHADEGRPMPGTFAQTPPTCGGSRRR